MVKDNHGATFLARYHDNAGGRSLEKLYVDTAGYPHPTGKARAIANVTLTPAAVWTHLNKHYQQPYRGEEDIDETPEVRRSVIGPVTAAFPLNEGWYAAGQTPHKDDGEPRCLSDLTIHEITVLLTERDTKDIRPNCEKNWKVALDKHLRRPYHIQFKWSDIWGSLGTPLSDPTEEKAWRRLLHRGIDAKNRHSKSRTNPNPDHTCRLKCGTRACST